MLLMRTASNKLSVFMHKSLYSYQVEGIDKLTKLCLSGGNALLADPPGAGKTPQAIYASLALGVKTALVLCPASIRVMWERELNTWAASTALTEKVLVITSSADVAHIDAASAVIVSYNLASSTNVLAALAASRWDVMILDEAHYLKSPDTARSRAALLTLWAASKYHLAITGTPVPNGRASEAWSLFSRLSPTAFGKWVPYRDRYCIARETDWGVTYPQSRNLPELGRIAREQFMVRRSREECMADLPAMVRQVVPLAIPPQEVQAGLNEIHPSLAAEVMKAIEYDLILLEGSGGVSTARRRLGQMKQKAAVEFIQELFSGEPLVVFAHHQDVIAYIAGSLPDELRVVCVTGDTPQSARQEAVDAFQGGQADIFLASITAASTGLTLTKSSTVIFVEADWVPSTNEQAEGRVLRRTQTALNCRAFYLVVPNSLDEDIMNAVVRKQKDISKLLEVAVRENSTQDAAVGFSTVQSVVSNVNKPNEALDNALKEMYHGSKA